MKNILFLNLIFIMLQSVALAGTDGHGGNPCVADFTQRATLMYSVIKDIPFFQKKLDMTKLQHKIDSADITIVEEELFDKNGGIIPAWNDGKNLIKLNFTRWCQYGVPQRTKIVLHEYLGLSQNKLDNNFQVSNNLYRQTGYSEENFNNLEKTGSNANINEMTFSHIAGNSAEGLLLETVSAGSYNGTIYIQDSARYQFRALLNCNSDTPQLKLSRVYASPINGRRGWDYINEISWANYNFLSKSQCLSTASLALTVANRTCLRIDIGLDTTEIMGAEVTDYSCNH